MENTYGIWKSFFTALPKIKQKLELPAKRSGIDTDAALYLILLLDFSDDALNIPDKLKNEIINKGLAEYNGNSMSLTGKGAILAKSFVISLEK